MTLENHNVPLNVMNEDKKSVILLTMHNNRDAKLIASYLSDSMLPVISNRGLQNTSFDLCILDERSFRENREIIRDIKRVLPVFLPVLVLVNNPHQAHNDAGILEYADDIIHMPVKKHVLQSRIKMLLRQHRYSRELHQKNRELKKKNEQLDIYRQAMDATNTGILLVDANKKDNPITYSNKGFREMTGYSEEQITGRNCRFLQNDDRDQDVIDDIRATIENGEEGEFTLRNYRKDGTLFWNKLNLAPIKNEQGDISHYVGIQNDVTELVEAQKELKEERDFIDAAIKSLPDVFYMVDEDLNYVKWNDTLEEELGYGKEEIKNMHPLDFFAEKDYELILSKINHAFETGSAEVEVEIKDKNGNLIPYYVTGKKLRRDGKNFLVGSCTNLANLKKAEYKSRQQEQLLKAIINQAESVIYVKDSNGVMQLVNDSYLKLFGLKREKVIGKTSEEIFGDAINIEIEQNDRQVMENSRAMEFEEKITIDGKDRYYHTIKYPLQGVPGYEQCICGISTDITDRKEVLSQLQERVKEQKCLYNISRLSEQQLTIDELLKKAVNYLPNGWQYPEITEARIKFNNKTFVTANYRTTPWTQSAGSKKIAGKQLLVTVAYTEMRGNNDEELFLKEERELIDTIAETLAGQINRILAEQKLRASEERWKKLVANDPNFIILLSQDSTIKYLNPAAKRFLKGDHTSDLLGCNLFDIVKFDKPELAKKRMQRATAGEVLEPEVYKTNARNGQTRYIKKQ